MAVKILVAFLTLFAVSKASDQLVGGISEAGRNDPQVLEALDFAMNEFNKMSNNFYRFLPSSITEATKQVCTLCQNTFSLKSFQII